MAEETKFEESFLDFSNIPSSMDELLQSSESTNAFTKGKIVEGKIVAKRPDGALVDIGYKAEGFVPASEFLKFDEANIGDKIDVYLEEIENRNNMPELSLEKANSIKAWNRITTEYGEGHVVKGFMRHRVKGGIMVDVEGFPAFLPGSQLDVGPVRNMEDYIGKEFDVKIIKINQDRRNIVVSRRELLEESLRDQRSKLLAEMKVDELRKGVVKNITDFGAFIDLGGVDGLLHITDISWGRISHPSEVLQVGQEIEVVIIGIDKEKERVSLGLKQKTRNPWDDVVSKYPKGSKINGKVVNIHATTQLKVVLVKPEHFEDASTIADHLNNKRTVVLNLESTNKEVSRRLVDFLSGVAYANNGQIKRVANSTFIITPYNVDIMGDLLDELENNGAFY